jgi:hypothetical protein
VQNEKELFNHRHSSLRITIEHAFESLKRRFKILDDAKSSRYHDSLLHNIKLDHTRW